MVQCQFRLGTIKTYAAGTRKFIKFCNYLGVDPFTAVEEHVLAKAAILFCHGCSVNSLDSWMSAVSSFQKGLGHPDLPRLELYHATRAGLFHIYGQVDTVTPATAVDWADIKLLYESLDFSCIVDVRFWCATILGFQGLFRAGEIGRVRLSEIVITDDALRVTIAFSKKDPHPVPVTMVARGDWACPVVAFRLLRRCLARAGEQVPFPLSYSAFNVSLQKRCRAAGISKEGISSHSLRRGGTTQLALAGVPESFIQAHGRRASLEYRLHQLPRLCSATSTDGHAACCAAGRRGLTSVFWVGLELR